MELRPTISLAEDEAISIFNREAKFAAQLFSERNKAGRPTILKLAEFLDTDLPLAAKLKVQFEGDHNMSIQLEKMAASFSLKANESLLVSKDLAWARELVGNQLAMLMTREDVMGVSLWGKVYRDIADKSPPGTTARATPELTT